MKALVVFFVFILMTVSGFFSHAHSQSEEWKQFFTNSVGDNFYYDPKNVKYDESDQQLVKVQVKALNRRENARVRDISQVIQIDCLKRSYRKLGSHTTYNDGSVYSDSRPSEWTAIVAGSAIEPLPDIVCKKTLGHRRGRE
ncbi:MAG: hypothetical protein NTU69_12585 [Proteobacteria bacterium]|nr:hypothetical protein [Pseudomonadota bacterium]